MTMSYHQQQPHPGYPQPAYQLPPPPPPAKTRRWPWVVVGVLGGILLLMIVAVAVNPPDDTNTADRRPTGEQAAGMPAAEAPASDAAAKPAGPATAMTGGLYEVGVDVQPGQYKTPGPSGSDLVGMCYWARHKNDSGEFEAIISNGNLQGPGSVTIAAGEFFEVTGACTWSKVG